MSEQFVYGAEEAQQARESVNSAADEGRKVLSDALSAAERTIGSATKAIERAFKDSLEAVHAQIRAYTNEARQPLEGGQRYVSKQVRQRPLTATLAGLGMGLLLGLLLSSRSK
jgi:ElaB/YqjD/DUF883 family membrane-anchored ribosome-binding protein